MNRISSLSRPFPSDDRRHRSLFWGALLLASACGSGSLERDDAETASAAESDPEQVSVPVDPESVGGGSAPGTEVPLPGAEPPDSPVARHGQLRVDGTQLLDAAEQPTQLRGLSSMWLNWESGYGRNREGLLWARDNWNVELVRAAMGVEPNNAYLANPTVAVQQLETVVENALVAGLYVIIDWHDHSAHTHQAEAIEFFSAMAERWGAYPNVLYEVYNEPVPPDGTWANLKPYHEAVVAAIRAKDPDNIIILGTPNWSQRPDEAAADPVLGDNLMYTLHFYSCDHGVGIRNYGQAALDAGLAVFVTEWGATTADGGLPETGATLCLDEAQAWHDWMNAESISWAAWKFEACADASCIFAAGAPQGGGWTQDSLQGHGPFVVERLLD